MQGRRIRENRTAHVLHVHLPADRNTKVAHLPGFGQTTQAIGLDFTALTRRTLPRVQMILKRMQAFVQHDRLRGMGGHNSALIQRFARLLKPSPRNA